MDIEIIDLDAHGDARGQLVAIEGHVENGLPFEIRRVYYMYDTDENAVRGLHAHKKLEQVLICVHGSCKVTLDDGQERKTVELDDPEKGLYLQSCVWREMHDFSPEAVLLVLASEHYDESDYIRDYEEYLNYIESS